MNKFKKIMLGALSVLTLGLFVVTGTKVNAANVDKTSTQTTPSLNTEYTLQSSTVLANNSTINGSTDISGYYGVFSLTGSKWTLKGTNTDKLCSNGDGSTDAQKCLVSIPLTANQKITYSINAIASGDSITANKVFVNGAGYDTTAVPGTTTLNKLGTGTNLPGEYTTESAMDFVFWFKNKTGFNSITITISDTSKSVSSMDSVTVNKTYHVGDSVAKTDLTVMSTYTGESSAVTTQFTYEVFKYVDGENDTKVTGAFTTSGTYYVIATSTEDTSKSVTSSNFTVGEQTKFTYDCNEITLTDTFKDDTNNHDYTTDDGVIAFNTFKKYVNSSTYNWDDGASYNTNGLQGSTMTITLAKAAKITVHATQTGGTAGKHDIRYMYFEDENDNCIVSEMNFSISSSSVATKKAFSINLAAGTYTTHSTDGGFNFYDIIIDYTDSTTLDTTNTTLILEHSTGTALSGTGTAARFVGVLKNVNIDDITSITLDLTLTKTGASAKNASETITSVYTGLPGYDVEEGTLYFYYVITGLEKTGFEGCTIKGTATIVMGTSKGYSTTTWTNA